MSTIQAKFIDNPIYYREKEIIVRYLASEYCLLETTVKSLKDQSPSNDLVGAAFQLFKNFDYIDFGAKPFLEKRLVSLLKDAFWSNHTVTQDCTKNLEVIENAREKINELCYID